ncbi:CBN-PUF-8 protein [Caenorhabditis brenneri]|uniref:CBN-PUF-8 protein n=1 Tax=Caenorhabditis brenneri TaxID=135651 RepID=G0N9C6_CAEBE|nr:CBN-PUF-8 protein [Caenorhabditis brenneri]
MSRPISIDNHCESDPVASPIESLVKSFGAQQIVDSVCGSPINACGRHIAINPKNERLPDTPEFQFSAYMTSGGRALGQNTYYMFGTPPSCTCSQENIPINSLNPHMICGINNNYMNPQWIASPMISHNHQLTQIMPHAFTDPQMHQVPTQPIRVPLQPSATGIFASTVRENAVACDLLTRYRSNPALMKGLKLSDIKGNLLKFAKDQVGSRFIQQKLEYCDKKEKDSIFDEVVANAAELVDDIFGNYVVQKFFEYGEEKHWAKLVDAVVERVPEYAFQMYACRVLQKALEKVNEPLQIKILNKVRHVIYRCMKDQNGNHVVQKAIEKVGPEYIQFIVDTLLKNHKTVFDMSVDPYGCRVVQRCLEHCIPKQTRPIIERILERFDEVTNNQYGNYVVQHVIQHGTDEDRMFIIKRVAEKLFEFATHKYSSNVIEKCLEEGTVYHKNMIVRSACNQPEGNMPVVVQMMKDQYANYVVQKMFDQVTTDQRRELIQTVRPHIPVLRQFPHGKHILAKLDKYFIINYPYQDHPGKH